MRLHAPTTQHYPCVFMRDVPHTVMPALNLFFHEIVSRDSATSTYFHLH